MSKKDKGSDSRSGKKTALNPAGERDWDQHWDIRLSLGMSIFTVSMVSSCSSSVLSPIDALSGGQFPQDL